MAYCCFGFSPFQDGGLLNDVIVQILKIKYTRENQTYYVKSDQLLLKAKVILNLNDILTLIDL